MGTKKEWKCIGEHLFTKNTDVLITDPCYLMYGERGESMPLGELESWCAEHGLISSTFYGDWGCVEDVEATGCMCPEVERSMKQEVSFDM